MYFSRREPPRSPEWIDYRAHKRWEAILIVGLFIAIVGVTIAIMGWHWTAAHTIGQFTGLLASFGALGHLGHTIHTLRQHPLDGTVPLKSIHSVKPVHPVAALPVSPHASALPVWSPHWGLWTLSLVIIMLIVGTALLALYRYPPNPPPYQESDGRPVATVGGSRFPSYAGTLSGSIAALALAVLFHGFLWPLGWWTFRWGVWLHWSEALTDLFALFFGAILVSRLYWRLWRQARTVWDEVVFYQDDQIPPPSFIGVIDNIYEVLQTRSPLYNNHWWYHLWVGQNSWSINLLRAPDRPDPTRITFILAGPDPAIRRVEQALATRYSNLRFWRTEPPQDHHWRFLLRWRLRYRTALHVIRLVSHDPTIPFDNVVQTLSSANTTSLETAPPVFIQLMMTPVSTRRARNRVQRAVNWARWGEMHSETEAAQQMQSLIGNGRWQTEWRAAADDYDMLMRLTGAWAFESKYAEILPRNVLTFRQQTRYWMTHHLPKMWPLVRGPVLWSSEVASVFLLPTGQTRVDDLHRLMIRRMPVPLAVNRTPAQAIVEGETNVPNKPWIPVGLHDQDREKNVLVRGIQGAGKSNTLINLVRADANERLADGSPARAVVLIDIGKDTAAAALEMVPPDREVIWFSPHEENNGWSLQALASNADRSAQVSHALQMLKDTFGDDAIGPRSEQILTQALRAIIEAKGPAASLTDLRNMLTDEKTRRAMLEKVSDNDVLDYWNREFEDGRKANAAFWEEALAAPRNKLDALLRHERVRASMDFATAREQMREVIDWDEVIAKRKVVILNIDKGALGTEATRLFGIAGLLGLWYAMQRQTKLKEEDRHKVSVIIDEAQNFLSKTFASIVTEGRAMGLQLAVAVRFLEEITDPLVRNTLINLCQNQIVYRTSSPSEAKELMYQVQRLFHNNVTLAEDVLALTNFSADDFMHLPNHMAICMWQAQGHVQMAFNARTFDWRPYRHPEWAAYHKANQPTTVKLEEPTGPTAAQRALEKINRARAEQAANDLTPNPERPESDEPTPVSEPQSGHAETLPPPVPVTPPRISDDGTWNYPGTEEAPVSPVTESPLEDESDEPPAVNPVDDTSLSELFVDAETVVSVSEMGTRILEASDEDRVDLDAVITELGLALSGLKQWQRNHAEASPKWIAQTLRDLQAKLPPQVFRATAWVQLSKAWSSSHAML